MALTESVCMLSAAQEDDLSSVIQSIESRLFGLTLIDVRKVVFLYCKKNGIANYCEKSGMAGTTWMDGFRKCHPQLSLSRKVFLLR